MNDIKINYKLILCLIVAFLCIFIYNFFSHKKGVNNHLSIIPKNCFYSKNIKNIVYNKVIIVGDSRMEFLHNRKKNINIPVNFNFIALGGTKIDWFEECAIKELEKKLDNMNDNYKYHVVINMGVNDLNDNLSAKKHADDYFYLINKLYSKYSNVNFYIMSVNPINDIVINKRVFSQSRSTLKIKEFNSEIIRLKNVYNCDRLIYCDSFNDVDFVIPDGLHYDKATDQRIVDYIVNDCVRY